jgi:hypothetical protein
LTRPGTVSILGGAMTRVRIGVDEAHSKYERGEITVIDQLTTNQHRAASRQIAGAIRIPAAELPDRLAELPRDRGVISYCT